MPLTKNRTPMQSRSVKCLGIRRALMMGKVEGAAMTEISKTEDIRELTSEEIAAVAGGQGSMNGSGSHPILSAIDHVLDCLPGPLAHSLDSIVDCLLHQKR
jgi:hypothetical protein